MLRSRLLPSSADTRHFVVLLHAFPLSSSMWDRMVVEFEEQRDDTTFLLIDFPGFGESIIQPQWTMQSISGEICQEIRKHTSERVILGGVSMGGYAALAFYREYPGMLSGLVLSNTKTDADSETAKRDREAFALDAIDRGPDAAIERLYSQFVTEETDPEIAIDIRNWISQADPLAIAAALRAMASRADSHDLLSLISISSLLITGTRDQIITPIQMRQMAIQLQDATYVEMAEATHLTPAERPKEWADALAGFLDRI